MTDIATNLNTIDGSLSDIKTAIVNKGGTVSGNITTFATAIDNIPSGGGTPSGTTDVPLTRIKDDNNNEIGTWFMNFEDGDGNIFKVILLDARYRSPNSQWCSNNTTAVTNMPIYSDLKSSNVWESKESATQNTQLILDFCTANNYTSAACTNCRNQSFTINGTTYYGQLPNMIETSYIARKYNSFDALDTSASSYSWGNFSSARSIWISNQYSLDYSWCLRNYCGMHNYNDKKSYYLACPVLEIPLS